MARHTLFLLQLRMCPIAFRRPTFRFGRDPEMAAPLICGGATPYAVGEAVCERILLAWVDDGTFAADG